MFTFRYKSLSVGHTCPTKTKLTKIKALPLKNTKIKILEQLLKQKIDEFKKVNKIKGVDFSKKMKKIIDKYNTRTEIDVERVHDETLDAIFDLINELKEEQESFKKMNIDYEERCLLIVRGQNPRLL